jgi:hypothetical protein
MIIMVVVYICHVHQLHINTLLAITTQTRMEMIMVIIFIVIIMSMRYKGWRANTYTDLVSHIRQKKSATNLELGI